MLQTMLVADITSLQSKNELRHWENQPFSGGAWIETSNRKTEITKNRTIKKKTKRARTAFTTDQIRSLEKTFLTNKYINSENRRELSRKLKIGEKCIKIWFQNRRMKEKRASSESSDTSSETYGRETVSPIAQSDTDLYQVQNQMYETNQYYQPITFQVSTNPEALYEPNFIQNIEYNNGFTYYSETHPCQQFQSNYETDVNNLYQNQYQYGNEMYNWCQDTTDLCNFYQ